MSYFIANVSFGKDSLAMLHKLIEEEMPLDEVAFYDTGMEFQAVYDERDRTLPLLEERGIRYTELRPKRPFWVDMFIKPVRSRKTGEVHKYGYGWCGGSCRWGTSAKTAALDRYARERDATVYVGIAADEGRRIERERVPWMLMPLVDWGMAEADCLELCYRRSHEWREGDVRLYDILDRVSCWCCRNKNQHELRMIHDHLPDYWQLLKGMEYRLGDMKARPLGEIGGFDWNEG